MGNDMRHQLDVNSGRCGSCLAPLPRSHQSAPASKNFEKSFVVFPRKILTILAPHMICSFSLFYIIGKLNILGFWTTGRSKMPFVNITGSHNL